jgi:hypothetical protein
MTIPISRGWFIADPHRSRVSKRLFCSTLQIAAFIKDYQILPVLMLTVCPNSFIKTGLYGKIPAYAVSSDHSTAG